MTEWISIKEAHPEKDGSYIVCTQNGAVCTAHYYKGAHRFSANHGRLVKYWMPMPEAPKEG